MNIEAAFFPNFLIIKFNCMTTMQKITSNMWFAYEAKEAQQCGWLKDKYGLSWQVVPGQLSEMMSDHVTKRSESVMKALLQMKKLNIKKLEEAYNGEAVLL